MKLLIEFETNAQLTTDQNFNAIFLHAIGTVLTIEAQKRWNEKHDLPNLMHIKGNDYNLKLNFETYDH